MALSDSRIKLDARYPALPAQVARIRQAVSEVANGGGADLESLLRIELAVSEAATNVVLHAYRTPAATGAIHVTANVVDGSLGVCIRDSGVGMSTRDDSPGLGLGLDLMAHEADHIEIREVPAGGTEVYMRFGLRAGAVPVPRRRIMHGSAAHSAPPTAAAPPGAPLWA